MPVLHWEHIASIVTNLAYVPALVRLWTVRARYHVAFCLTLMIFINSCIYHMCLASDGDYCLIDLEVSTFRDKGTAEFGFIISSIIGLRIPSVMRHNITMILFYLIYDLLKEATDSIFLLVAIEVFLVPVVMYRSVGDTYNFWYFIISIIVFSVGMVSYYVPIYPVFHPIWHICSGLGYWLLLTIILFSAKNHQMSIAQIQNPETLIVYESQILGEAKTPRFI